MTSILGISAFYHDSAACIIKDGKIVAAAQEERFTRIKHDSSYPYNAIEFVLKYLNLKLNEVDQIVFYEKPFLKFERILETYLAFAPKGFASFSKSMPLWIKEKLFQKNLIFNNLKRHDQNYSNNKNIFFSEHHLSHAASAFFPSPFEEAAVLTADGVGEWATTTLAIGRKNKLEIKKEIFFPHSLGLLYSAFTYYTGFKVNSGEYKLMGLAPYGKPIYVNKIKELIDIKEDGTFRLDQSYFNYATGPTMTSDKFHKLFGNKPRIPNEKINQFYMDIASSIQNVTEEIMIKLAKSIRQTYNIENLCLAGGVALNCVANGKILKKNIFKNIWIQPAAGDAGGSIGAALALWYDGNNKRLINKCDDMKELNLSGANFVTLDYKDLINQTAYNLSKEKIIGWFQGRMEFGPRSLGARSILADSRSDQMQKKLNLKIKFRESFRPFAPSILREELSTWFDLKVDSPYMLFVTNINSSKKINYNKNQKKVFGVEKINLKRSSIPSVTHVDYSARVHTVTKKNNKYFYDLISKFKKLTQCPVITNTSFNIRGEPIVNTPTDAFNCFMSTELDYLVIGNCLLDKKKQNLKLKKNYKNKFKLD